MFAAFIVIFVAFCTLMGFLSLLGAAMDRTTYNSRNRYSDDVPARHRTITHNGFKSRAGIR